jgi:hypothetical protein
MTEEEWLESTNPHLMLEFLRDKSSDRQLRLIAVASCERAKKFTEYWHHELAQIAEAFAEGEATLEQMQAVRARHRPSNDYPDRNAFYNTTGLDLVQTIPALVEDLADWIASCQVDDEGKSLGGWEAEQSVGFERELAITAGQVRDIAGNPFRPVPVAPAWQTANVVALAQAIYDERAFDRMPILGDALEDAGCDNADILNHCRQPGEHVRGCWVVDLLLGKK